jgi:hypothetical protein
MGLSVRAKADTVATYRHVAIFLMETLARWTPASPEFEAKAMFGRHIWDMAQLADQLGKRTAELRMALHQSRNPVDSYRGALTAMAALPATADRIAAFYDAALPDLVMRFNTYLEATDQLLDEPTVRILERARLDIGRMLAQRDALVKERPELKKHDPSALARTRAALAAVPDFVDYQPAPAEAR